MNTTTILLEIMILLMKIYKRKSEWKIERFVTANLWWLDDDELELLQEFNLLQIHEFTVLLQRNPIRKDADNFEEEHLRLEVEYRGDLLRIFACNDIKKFIENMDRSNLSMENKEEEIAEIVDQLKDIQINVLDPKKTSWGL